MAGRKDQGNSKNSAASATVLDEPDRNASDRRGEPASHICIRGARTHNLKDLHLEIPRNRLVVVTGPSGSGKSSLAFDTVYAEGQRQYIESLSVYARQFFHQLERPEVDLIEGLQPTISIDQRSGAHNPRSTVATVTEVYDYLRLLYSRVGTAHCYICGRTIRQQAPEQIIDAILQLPEGTRLMLLAPLVRGRRGQHKEVLRQIAKAGFVRARVDDQIVDVEDLEPLDPQKRHSIEAVIDRIVLRDGIRPRLAESLKLAVKHGDGLVVAVYEKERLVTPEGTRRSIWKDRLYSTKYACAKCQINYAELEPRTFSFNSPYGVCTECEGMGSRVEFDVELIVPDLSLSISEGACVAWKHCNVKTQSKFEKETEQMLAARGVAAETPLEALDDDTLGELYFGDDEQKFPGLVGQLEDYYEKTKSKTIRKNLHPYRVDVVCRACDGSRLRPESRSVTVAKKCIHEVTAMTVVEALEFFEGISFDEEMEPIARPIFQQIIERLDFMNQVGLDYLTLDRPTETLSGGELQRVRLATGLGSGLVGVCYVLDEPSIGLHPRDNHRLIDAMRRLQRRNNTVLVVEHDEAIMRRADWLIDMGPGAGRHGGEVIDQGPPEKIQQDARSLTGKYLSGKDAIEVPRKRRRIAKTRSIFMEGVTTNNLQNISVRFPLGTFLCVTGVSGSGKSSLLNETLVPALVRRLGGSASKPGPHTSLRGASSIDKIIRIDQSPIGRSPRSNPATYTGVFDEIRKVFSKTRESKRLGFKAGRFSFNVKGGRCEECQGQGTQKIEMHFLPDLYAVCPECEGRRFNRQTLEIHYREKNIADVLQMQVDDAIEYFENIPAIVRLLESLRKVGLGYLTLGQASTTLSGGEAQRIKLATELARVETGNTLYVLDEPTSGLHAHDIKQLIEVLSQLVDLGNTVIVIEHNLDVIKTADWIIDLGPEGGQRGGRITATGTPEDLAAMEENHTGRFLRTVLGER
jgi:excinuclease ABC subunit A